MMERVEATITIAAGETEATVDTGYVSGLIESIYVWAVIESSPALTVQAIEPIGTTDRIIINGVPLSGENNAIYPRTPVVDTRGTPSQFSEGFPVVERIPVYGRLKITITNGTSGDVFNIAIYLSNSNPNGR